MMNRRQRIDYEILDHVLNAGHANGYPTDLHAFTLRLRERFPLIQTAEFIDACKRLHKEDQMEQRRREDLVYRPYLTGEDDHAFFSCTVYLTRGRLTRDYFLQLQRYIEVPSPPKSG